MPNGVGDAVGVEKPVWFVAIVNNNTEKAASEKLTKAKIQHYVPIQIEYKVWKNGKKAKVKRVVIPCVVFVYCTEKQRLEIVKFPFISRFMVNRSKNNSNSTLAIVPDNQIDKLKFMLGQSDIPITIGSLEFQKGDTVRVIRGSLMGLQGEVKDMSKDKCELVVDLNLFGSAKLTIDRINLERV